MRGACQPWVVRAGFMPRARACRGRIIKMRTAPRPGAPTPRAEWIRSSVKGRAAWTGVEQMAVHDYGEVAVVSFLGRRDAHGAKGHVFVVDIWVRAQGAWKLSTRYAGPVGDRGFIIPGAAAGPPVEKKY